MFKIISKKKYEELIEENAKLSAEIKSIKPIENGKNNHVCNELCVGCKHRVKNDDIYNVVYGGGLNRFNCDLNRTCEDYEKESFSAKEFINEIKKTIIGVDVQYVDADGYADRCTEAVPVEWIKKAEQKFGEAESDG